MIVHSETGYVVDPAAGVVFGRKGSPIGAPDVKGYLHISLRLRGSQRGYLAHRLIWEAANGPLAPGLTINHINGIKNDNRLENLEAVTQKENIHHAMRNGLTRVGEDHPNAKLKRSDVEAIRVRHAAGEPRSELAAIYGVTERHIYQITTGRRWAA